MIAVILRKTTPRRTMRIPHSKLARNGSACIVAVAVVAGVDANNLI
jgi:hypothetical protein